jgi:CRISPR-associated protein Cmr1
MRKISDEMKAFAQTDDFKEQLASNKLNTKDTGRITQTRKYKLITPLFGGGVKPKEADPIKVIRETSIRGQLRFWWRAMRGVGTLEEMKKREDALFGSGDKRASQSKVLIAIKVNENGKIDNEGRPEEPFCLNNGKPRPTVNWEKIAYAAFPLQPTNEEIHRPMKRIQVRVEFRMKISFPGDAASKKDVEAALWAWETFGGIGGRTRRGFGALQLSEIDGVAIEPMKIKEIKPEEGESRIVKELKEHLAKGTWDVNVPHLPTNLTFTLTPNFTSANSGENNLEAWENLIDKLRQFRQARRTGSDPERPMKKGRSYWSEPDEIRRITGRDAYGQHEPKHKVRKFPRAEFGLPIIFHFIGNGEPSDTELKPVDFTRLASPLILRPIACSDGAVGIALILETPPLPSIELKGYGAVSTQLVKDATTDDIANIEPMRLASATETDVLKSFLKTI